MTVSSWAKQRVFARLTKDCQCPFPLRNLSEAGSLWKHDLVDSIVDILGCDACAIEEATIQAAIGVLAAGDSVEHDVNFSIVGGRINTDVANNAILDVTLLANIFFCFGLPASLGSTREESALIQGARA